VSGPISAAEGQRLSGLLGCIACHTTNGTVGSAHFAPSWKGLFGSTVTLDDGSTRVADEDYIRNHIFKRTARHVRGFENSMPDYTGIATDSQAESLVLYIKTLR
jgi:cytochrome c oxidase subunit 2